MNSFPRFSPRVLLWAALLPLASCASGALPPLREDPAIVELKAKFPESMPYKVGLAVKVPDDRLLRDERTGSSSCSIRIDVPALRAELAEALRQTGAFRHVEEIGGDVSLQAVRYLYAEACEKGTDFLFLIEPKANEIRFEGRNFWWFPSVLLWMVAWAPSWWIPDETFSMERTGTLSVIDVPTGRIIRRMPLSGIHAEKLDDFDRSWDFTSILAAPYSFELGNFTSAAETVGPPAFRSFAVEAARQATVSFREFTTTFAFAKETGRGRPRKLCLVVGIDKTDDAGLPALDFAEADARFVSEFLVSRRFGASPEDVTILTGRGACRTDILAGARRIAELSVRNGDSIFFYFGGYGLGVEGKDGALVPCIVPADWKRKPTAGAAIRLDEIADILSRSKAEKVVMAIDASFGPERKGRSIGFEAGEAPLSFDMKWAQERKGLAFFLGSDPHGTCLEVSEIGHGLFTANFVAGARGAADRDENGKTTMEELLAHASKSVADLARLIGESQAPELFAENRSMSFVEKPDAERKAGQPGEKKPVEKPSPEKEGEQ